jgi:hypothetical protein
MKKEQSDYDRDYIHITMRRNTSTSKKAPDFVAHSLTSDYLKQYVAYCVKNNKEITFDFAINEKSDEKLLLVLSVPFFEKRRPTNLLDHFE